MDAQGSAVPNSRRLLTPWDGARYRRMSLDLDADGAVTLHFHAMGPGDEAPWGADDDEVTVRLPPAAAARLAFGMLAEGLKGREDAIEALLALCEAHGVQPEFARWT